MALCAGSGTSAEFFNLYDNNYGGEIRGSWGCPGCNKSIGGSAQMYDPSRIPDHGSPNPAGEALGGCLAIIIGGALVIGVIYLWAVHGG